MDAVVGESVAIAGTVVGAALSVVGALRISRRERRDALNDRMRDAFGLYLGAVYPTVSELRELPPPVRHTVDAANDYVERLGQRRTPELKAE